MRRRPNSNFLLIFLFSYFLIFLFLFSFYLLPFLLLFNQIKDIE